MRIWVAPWISFWVVVDEGGGERGSMKAGLRGFQNSGSGWWGLWKKRFMFMMMMKRSLMMPVGSREVAWAARHCFFVAVSDGCAVELS